MFLSAGDLIRAGSFLNDMLLSLGVFGSTKAIMHRIMAAKPPMTKNVALHPRRSPMVLPSGRPTIIATEEPHTTNPNAAACFPSGAILTANGVTIDQKTAWAQATPSLEVMSM